MAVKRRRGGQPGNLNGVKHARHVWLKRRALPAHLSHVKAMVLQEEQALTADKGGEEAVTAAERAMIYDCGIAGGLILLALEEARHRGCITVDKSGQWDLMPGLQRVRALIDARRAILVALGLARREREIPDLATALARQGETSR